MLSCSLCNFRHILKHLCASRFPPMNLLKIHSRPNDEFCIHRTIELLTFSKVTGYKTNMQKSIFLYILSMKNLKAQLRKQFLHSFKKIKILTVSLTEVPDLYSEHNITDNN